ncbi:TetR/AcrR family transcriptional regulator [Solimonas variicoloris]|uniref:TetR/AcrR family transcriptional regulator n=1 Tax=Solimonas variicoloris TaxID=254408 RepID=UPI000367B465|nr:TetR/AcrR family transcriptional regulator [Solimonas variicoloris]
MSRGAAKPHAPRLAREDRIADILVAARDVFCEKGYEQTAVAEIATRIGVVEGTVYKYFATKRELLLKVLEHWYEEMFGDYARDLIAVKGARARLRLLVWRHLRSIRDYPLLCRLMFREIHGEADYHGSGLHALNRQYTQFLVDVIDEGRAAGELRSDVPTALLRDLIYGAAEHHTWAFIHRSAAANGRAGSGRDTLDIDTLADQITSIVCDGIARPDATLEDGMQRLSRIAARLESTLDSRAKGTPRNRSRA